MVSPFLNALRSSDRFSRMRDVNWLIDCLLKTLLLLHPITNISFAEDFSPNPGEAVKNDNHQCLSW